MEILVSAIVIFFSLVCTIGPFFLGIIGMQREKAHFKSLDEREKQFSGILISDMKRLPHNWEADSPKLVTGHVVIATDHLKQFFSSWRKIFGGRMISYEKMVERARREAVLRMLEQAAQNRANVVWNLRITTMTIQNSENGGSAGVEVLAYGTAMHIR